MRFLDILFLAVADVVAIRRTFLSFSLHRATFHVIWVPSPAWLLLCSEASEMCIFSVFRFGGFSHPNRIQCRNHEFMITIIGQKKREKITNERESEKHTRLIKLVFGIYTYSCSSQYANVSKRCANLEFFCKLFRGIFCLMCFANRIACSNTHQI